MKRILLILGILLFSNTLKAQSVEYTCRYWFDQNHAEAVVTNFGVDGWEAELDVGALTDGLHSLHIHVMDTSMIWTAPQSFMFMRMPVEEQIANLYYHCWFDQDCENVQTGLVGNGIFELEVGDLSNGIHTVNVQLDNGAMTAPQSYLFYKQPLGGYGVARWEYWLNGDMQNKYVTNISPAVDTLDIITLLSVGHPELRSSCFHFHPNGDEPYINAKNEITFRFWDAEMRFFDKSEFFVDEQVQQDINAQVFERNTTETFAAPRDNQIQWFKIEAGIGDSLAFKADKACTMQLFAPSGEKVYAVSASEAMVFDGCHAWEDGTYYLAVHDMTGSGDEMSVTYQHLDKYVVLAYTPTEIGNTWGVFELNLLGNGFDKLHNVLLVDGSIEWQMDTIMYSHISEGAIRFAMDSLTNNGNYDIVLYFEDQESERDTLVLSNAIQVVEAKFGTIDIDYNYKFNTTSPYLIMVTITNNGNVEYQGIPVLFAHTNIDNVKFDLYNDWLIVQEDYFENGGRGIYYTDNLFNQGIEGKIIPLIIPKLGSYGTREITLIVDAESGTVFDFYAWGGIPWSVKTQEAYDADANYCQTHTESPGWEGNHNSGNGGDTGSIYGGGSVGGAHYTVGSHNERAGNTHRIASDAFYDSCHGLPDFCQAGGSLAECICGEFGATGATLQNAVGAGVGLYHRAQLEGLGSNFSYIEDSDYGQHLQRSAYHRRLRTPGGLLRDAIGHCTGLLPDGAQQAADNALEAWGLLSDDCVEPPCQRPSIPMPIDPNDIFGYTSESGSHYMTQEIQNIHYEIEFENDTTLATAAAHTIIVRDTLDATKFALNSLAAHSVTIGDKRLELNGEQTFARTLDMRPELYVIAQIEQDYDPATGIIQWTISSLDPMTMEPTDNPFQGVLPVNYFGDGVGFIDYSVNLKQMFADGTEISNRAGIIFDSEDLIMTPTWTNIVDAVKPTSTIADVIQVADTLNFIFSSEDNRSGIWYHTLYFRNESTEMEWKVKKSQILENNYKMNLEDLQMTEYFVLATDSAGNREDKDFLAEYIYSQDNVTLQNNTLVQGWNWWSTYVEQSTMDGLTTVENSLGNNGLTIKSQNEFTTNYYENMGYDYWYGGLEAIDNEHGYMINTNTACNVRMLGTPAQPEDHPITIGANWNWIGYPVGQQQLLATSISGTFQPESEDVMKNHSGFATYYPGYGWYPDDFVMTPGEGYLYKSNSTANKTLTYVLSRKHSSASKQEEIHQWKPEIHKYADNISVIAVLDMNGYEIRENIEVGAFVNGECRGSAILRYFEPTDRYYAMLSIAGEDDDVVSFEIQGSNSETHITFHKNDIIGSLDAPLPIEFGFLGNDVSDLTLYPNPVEHDANFSIDIPAWEKVSDVTITNVLGLVIRKESTNGINMNGIHEPGIYIVKITCKTGNVYQNVLIVK